MYSVESAVVAIEDTGLLVEFASAAAVRGQVELQLAVWGLPICQGVSY